MLLIVFAGGSSSPWESSARRRGRYTQAFLVALVYSALPYEAVEQTRNPPSTRAAGRMSFKWDMMPPNAQDSNCIATALSLVR